MIILINMVGSLKFGNSGSGLLQLSLKFGFRFFAIHELSPKLAISEGTALADYAIEDIGSKQSETAIDHRCLVYTDSGLSTSTFLMRWAGQSSRVLSDTRDHFSDQ